MHFPFSVKSAYTLVQPTKGSLDMGIRKKFQSEDVGLIPGSCQPLGILEQTYTARTVGHNPSVFPRRRDSRVTSANLTSSCRATIISVRRIVERSPLI